jgi:hypothetical protein
MLSKPRGKNFPLWGDVLRGWEQNSRFRIRNSGLRDPNLGPYCFITDSKNFKKFQNKKTKLGRIHNKLSFRIHTSDLRIRGYGSERNIYGS